MFSLTFNTNPKCKQYINLYYKRERSKNVLLINLSEIFLNHTFRSHKPIPENTDHFLKYCMQIYL